MELNTSRAEVSIALLLIQHDVSLRLWEKLLRFSRSFGKRYKCRSSRVIWHFRTCIFMFH